MSSSQGTHTPPLSRSPGRPESRLETTGMDGLLFSSLRLKPCPSGHICPLPFGVSSRPPTQPHSFNFPWGPRAPEVVRSQEALFSHWKLLAPNMYSTQIFPPSVPRLPSFSRTFCKMVPTLLSDQRPLLLAHFTDRETKATTVERTARTIPEQESFAPGF